VYWEVTIDKTAHVSDIMVGMVDINANFNDFLSHTKNGFALYGNNGQKYHNRSGLNYAPTGFRTGDTVGVYVDFKRDSIWFFINGKNVAPTPAFTSISTGLTKGVGKLYPSVTLYAAGDQVTLNPKATMPNLPGKSRTKKLDQI